MIKNLQTQLIKYFDTLRKVAPENAPYPSKEDIMSISKADLEKLKTQAQQVVKMMDNGGVPQGGGKKQTRRARHKRGRRRRTRKMRGGVVAEMSIVFVVGGLLLMGLVFDCARGHDGRVRRYFAVRSNPYVRSAVGRFSAAGTRRGNVRQGLDRWHRRAAASGALHGRWGGHEDLARHVQGYLD